MELFFGDRVVAFNRSLNFDFKLPEEFAILNPYSNNPETLEVMEKFYTKFYSDNNTRQLILGINPSRNGAGVTGIPFTDTKRLESCCGIVMHSKHTHEISSVFLYDVIKSFGGAKEFYKRFYINSPFPLAIVRKNKEGNWLNANYYDDKELFICLKEYMIVTLKKHISLGIDTKVVFVLGKKNSKFILKLNQEEKLFDKIIVLDHPRYIQQYKSKEKQLYLDEYYLALNQLV
jgi:hypothetical protein